MNNIITLIDENGKEVQFEFLDLIEYGQEEYVVLLPIEEDSGEVVILQVDENDTDDETESYSSVDDDETLAAVFEIFKEKFKDEFNFTE